MGEPIRKPEAGPERFDQQRLEIWREAMAHLRHLSDDLWKALRTFLTLNAILLFTVVGLVVLLPLNRGIAFLLALLSVFGVLLTLISRFILKRHRIYYLQMLAKKSLIEEELGFYGTKLAGTETDLAFPWRLTPEVVAEIKQNCEAWIQKSVRAKGTIARAQFLLYETLMALYCLAFLVALVRLFRRGG